MLAPLGLWPSTGRLCVAHGLARVAAGAVPTMAGVSEHGGGKPRPGFPRLLWDVQGVDRPGSPEMGPAEGTPIPPLTYQTEPSEGEWGRPQNPAALGGFAPNEGGHDDEVQQPCKPCFPHCGRGKEKMGEEDARERCPRNLPCLSPSAHSDTGMGEGYSTHSPGFSLPRQWVQHGSGTG